MEINGVEFKCGGKNCSALMYCNKGVSSMESAIEKLQKEKGWRVTEEGACLCPSCQREEKKKAQKKKTNVVRLSEIEDALTEINETLRGLKTELEYQDTDRHRLPFFGPRCW